MTGEIGMNLLHEIVDCDFTPYHKGTTVRNARTMQFVAWDGEGITYEGDSKQSFVLFGNSLGYRVQGVSLTTDECLEVMLKSEIDHPYAIHVGFAFSYDVEMILRDLPMRHLHVLRKRGAVKWHGYRIEYRSGKWFQITKQVNGKRYTCRIWDVWSFFSTSFIRAVDEYLGEVPEKNLISAGKSARGTFTSEQITEFIVPYWQAELKLLVELMNTLRTRLYDAGLTIRQWHGPGAISTFAMRKNSVQKFMAECPEEVNDAAQFAYAGGRFELFKVGLANQKVYSYDIRSAYPAAIATLPDLANGYWEYVENPTEIAQFGVYEIEFRNIELFSSKPMPYFYRDERSAVHFPNAVNGWYWSPEVAMAKYLGRDVTVKRGWVFHGDGSRPFAWVRDIYNTRAQWKEEGNPSQIALKLLLNSMYGKMAQRVGWERTGSAPRWHQLEWAGYVTSATRAKLFRAMLESHSKNSLIGVETDGIFSLSPLSLDLGPGLGQWEATEYDDMLYLQSGFYFKKSNGNWSAKYRGFDKGSVTFDEALASLNRWKPWAKDESRFGHILGTTTRFTSMGMYLRMPGGEQWRNTWVTSPRDLNVGSDGKRVHRSFCCQSCASEVSPALAMHDLSVTIPGGGMSIPHSLPWKAQPENPFREFVNGESNIREEV